MRVNKRLIDGDVWHTSHNTELYHLYERPDTVKINRLKWTEERAEETDPTMQIFYQRLMYNRPKEGPRIRLKDQVKEDLGMPDIRNWKTGPKYRIEWNRLLEETHTPEGCRATDDDGVDDDVVHVLIL